MRKRAIVVQFGFLFLLAAACMMPFTWAQGAEKKDIVVGAVNSMTGPDAMTGTEQKWAYEQAVSDINRKGGVFVKEYNKKLPIKLIFADDASVPDKAAAAMERLIRSNKIDLALSSDTTPKNLGAAVVAEKYKVFFLIDLAWPPMVEQQNYKWVACYFFTPDSASRVPFQIWEALPQADKPKRPALITEDNQDGQAFRETFQNWSKQYNMPFVYDNPAPQGNRDFSSWVLKMKSLDADALIFHGDGNAGITLMRQIQDGGLKLKYIHGFQGFWPSEFYKALGEKANYVIHDGFWVENNGAPMSKELGARFKKQFGRDSVSVGHHYAAVQVLSTAIEKAGSVNSAKVRDAVFNGSFKGTTLGGELKFDSKGIAISQSLALQWWNGGRMPVWPPAPSVWKLKLIPVQ
jgi:branched-chain amino acid transport system substrate-binding protein